MRFHNPDCVWFVTNRCAQERLFLLPRPEVKQLIGAWLAKSLAEHGDGIELYAFAFLSNHFHLLLRDPKGQLPKFMWYFQLNLAKAVNRALGRRGHFFHREYDAAPVLTDADFEVLYAYVVTNAVKAGLLARARGGPFFTSLPQALDETLVLEFEWVDQTRLHELTRRRRRVTKAEVTRAYRLRPAVPPSWRGWSAARRARHIEGLVAANEARYGRQRRAEGKGFLGARRILEQSPFMRPRESSFRPRVRVFCRDEALKAAFLEAVRSLTGLYRQVFDVFRKAARRCRRVSLEWPAWTYAPSCWSPVPAR
jgi:REP element-mobilizing transposase RayT